MSIIPKWQTPTGKGTDLFQTVIQAPASTQTKINGDPALAAALQDRYRSQIQTFIQSQRQAYALSTIELYRTRLTLPGMNVRYANMQGKEYINFDVAVESPNPQPPPGLPYPDIMTDGYIMWAHTGNVTPFGSFTNFRNDYQLSINGTAIGDVITYDNDTPDGIVILTYGKNALKLYASKETNAVNPNKSILSKILPERPVLKIPANQTLLEKAFGLFDFAYIDLESAITENVVGHSEYGNFKSIEQINYPFWYPISSGNNPLSSAIDQIHQIQAELLPSGVIQSFSGATGFIIPTIIEIPTNLLDRNGYNEFAIKFLGPTYPPAEADSNAILVADSILVEFFDLDPKTYRQVRQSRRRRSVDGSENITTNDSLMQWTSSGSLELALPPGTYADIPGVVFTTFSNYIVSGLPGSTTRLAIDFKAESGPAVLPGFPGAQPINSAQTIWHLNRESDPSNIIDFQVVGMIPI